jgi:hypothetical protein
MLKNIVSLLPILIMNGLVIVWFPNSYIFIRSYTVEEKPVRPLFAKGYEKMFLEDATSPFIWIFLTEEIPKGF